MEEGLRIKVVFEDEGILNASQKSEGLDRSWLLINPKHHRIISDLSSYLLHNFQLHSSCSHGLLLSMDGFVLPPFESTCLFKDKDVISVKKKGGSLAIQCDASNCVDDFQIVEKVTAKTKLEAMALPHEVFDIETGGYEVHESEKGGRDQVDDCDSYDGVPVSKKRKSSGKLHSPKKKKKCHQVAGGCNMDDQPELTKESKQNLTAKKSSKNQQKVCGPRGMNKAESNRETVEMSENNFTMPDITKNDQILESGKDHFAVTGKPEERKKGPSRSSRRQYTKRRLIRQMIKILKENDNSQLESNSKGMQSVKEGAARLQKGPRKWKKERDSDQRQKNKSWAPRRAGAEIEETPGQPKGLLYWKGLLCKDMAKDISNHAHASSKSLSCDEPVKNSNINGEAVPVGVRPEHICSELSGIEQAVAQNQDKGDKFAVNGLSPKKDQKLSKKISQGIEINEPHNESSELSSAEILTHGQPKGLLYWKGLLGKDMAKDSNHAHASSKSISCDEPVKNNNINGQAVPVEVRPEHVCSELSGKEQAVTQNQDKGENFVVNGISPKKDQKQSNKISQGIENNEPHNDSSEMSSAEIFTHGNGSIDFAKLPSLYDTPKDGDVIAYRLLELSSNWTADLSSHHVGRVSSFNSETSRVSLMPVAGYPFCSNKPREGACTMLPSNCLHKEDGSVEIDLSSLVDVRALKPTMFHSSKEDSARASDGLTSNTPEHSIGNNHKSIPYVQENMDVNHENEMPGDGKESGVNLWEQLSSALSTKKEQLSQQSSWGKVSPSKSFCSYEASKVCGFRRRQNFSRWKNKR
ncbi:hypothetical protein DM860_008131 [Cuscuta australis]|uniref:Uncharacterized protein n=1 Tax=Cuscuta australis TaxID=267555 RepID=A0A328D6P9_9ASTE|nr:hypothetical protein DM860_008131 [Cuscuta australis]